jgi:hypothetical protein
MIEIPLSRGLVALVDDDDANAITPYKWSARDNAGRYYAFRKTTRGHGAKSIYIQMHRMLIGADKGEQVDHINGNSLDNRRSNLRIVSHTINQANGGPQKRTKSRLKGVHSTGYPGRYEACISRDGKRIKSRWFTSTKQAALLRDEMARILYPEGIYLNFPNEECPSELAEYAKELVSRIK